MTFLLDSDTCAWLIKKLQPAVSRAAQNRGQLHLSAASVTELELWLLRTRTPSGCSPVS
jgi:PIN domain nuclease of toxin-antitoxin system